MKVYEWRTPKEKSKFEAPTKKRFVYLDDAGEERTTETIGQLGVFERYLEQALSKQLRPFINMAVSPDVVRELNAIVQHEVDRVVVSPPIRVEVNMNAGSLDLKFHHKYDDEPDEDPELRPLPEPISKCDNDRHEPPDDQCTPDTITIPRDTYELLKEAAEEWAKDWRRPTQLLRTVRCKSCLSATRIDELSTYHSAMVVHAADCKAARILGLEREG